MSLRISQYCHITLLRPSSSKKKWLRKGLPGPIKAKVHTTCSKQMATAFFDVKGLIYNNDMSRGTRVNAKYIVGALGKFLTIFRQKRRVMAVQEWFIH